MTNSETIEKLNEALTQLIGAYEVIQDKNNNLQNDIKSKDEIINDLEGRLSELNGDTEVQSTKMDSMLTRIQSLLTPDEQTISVKEEKIDDLVEDSILDLDLNVEDINISIDNEDNKNNNKIDLGRMESLLNGLNTK